MYNFTAIIDGAAVFEKSGSFFIDGIADKSILSPGVWTENSAGFDKITDAGLAAKAKAVSAANARLSGYSIFRTQGDKLTLEDTETGRRYQVIDISPEEITDSFISSITGRC